MTEIDYMKIAYSEALKDVEMGIYPVGALVVINDEIICKTRNGTVTEFDPTSHAEITAIREACKKLRRDTLEDAVLYTTLFPCPMCEAAIIEAKIKNVIFGADSYKWIREVKFSTEHINYSGPVLDSECRGIFENELIKRGKNHIIDYEGP
ncbi:MAG: nucleoside deaminase [Gammaproteobacteria bacterium]|nr:nucleoside deaminase [Gammaproteobacteria bacterium]